MLQRRSFLAGLASLLAAPAIVQASSLMPVRGIVMDVEPRFVTMTEWAAARMAWQRHWEEVAEFVLPQRACLTMPTQNRA